MGKPMGQEWKLDLALLAKRYTICRLPAEAEIPAWALHSGPIVSITRTPDELSIVCTGDTVPDAVSVVSAGWRCLRVAGPLDFALTGVLAALAVPLAAEGISIFALSTYETDYLLVPERDVERASAVLTRAGHTVRDDHDERAREEEPT